MVKSCVGMQDCYFTNSSALSCTVPNLELPEVIELPANVTRRRRDVMSVGVSEHHRLQRRSTDNVKVFEG